MLKSGLTAITLMGAVAAMASPAGAADEFASERLMLVRTTAGPASYAFTANVRTGQEGGFVGSVGARLRNGSVEAVAPGGQTSFGHDDAMGLRTPGASVTTCAIGVCTVQTTLNGQTSETAWDSGGSDAMNAVFVAIEGRDIRFTWHGSGWKLEQVPFAYRFVDGIDANAIGVGLGGSAGVEAFLDASAPGAAGGSVAQAQPPCSTASTSGLPARGVGQVTLDGGKASPSATCPATSYPVIADYAPAATTWLAHGLMVGDKWVESTRLLVIDVPRGV